MNAVPNGGLSVVSCNSGEGVLYFYLNQSAGAYAVGLGISV